MRSSDLKTGAVRRVLIPIVVLLVIVVPALNWLRPGRVPGAYFERCQGEQLRNGKPPADLVLLGASRTGFGIDEQLLDRDIPDGRAVSTEKVVLLGSSEADANLGLRSYMRSRGVPKILGIELQYSRFRGENAPKQQAITLTNRSYALFGVRDYAGYLRSMGEDGEISWTDTYVRSRMSSPASFFMKHLEIGVEHALRDPAQALKPFEDCDRRTLSVWDPVAATPYTEETPDPPQKRLASMEKNAERYQSINLASTRAQGETVVLRNLVDFAREQGVGEIFFYYFPSFGEDTPGIDFAEVEAEFPGIEILDFREALWDDSRPGLRLQFKDSAHVNSYGAYEVTKKMIEYVTTGRGAVAPAGGAQ
jgi:hypothetical protein